MTEERDSAAAPLVTIVTPSLNQGHFIRETIESVLSQDYPNIEYIVMDGGSTDDTATVVSEYSDRLEFFSEPDRGQSDAINKGWRHGHGDIMSWLCADDLLVPGAVSAVVAEFERCPDTVLVYGDAEVIDRDGGVLNYGHAGRPDVWRLIHGYDYIQQPAAFARREAIEAVGWVDERLHWGMDWDFFIRIALHGPTTYLPRTLAQPRQYDETKTLSGGRDRFRELVTIMRRYGDARYP
ncbi:MAG: glycosyltransferase, partial [Acidimicrobiia bacterium]|nr:glycosyltransferase [Acidimicrobiia bacterium]